MEELFDWYCYDLSDSIAWTIEADLEALLLLERVANPLWCEVANPGGRFMAVLSIYSRLN